MRTETTPRRARLADLLRADVVRGLLREAFAVESHGLDVRSGVAGAVAAVGPLAVGVAAGDRVAGLTAAIGGLNTALCVPRAGLRSRLWWGGLSAVAGAVALMLADVAAPTAGLLLVVTFLWVGAWALLRAAGPVGALVGFAMPAVLVVMGGVPPSGASMGTTVVWFAAGAVPGLALMVAVRRGPEGDPAPARAAWSAVWDGARHDPALQAHAARLAFAVTFATGIELALGLQHGYWVPLTVLAVLQPGEHATDVRIVQRAAGTLVGVALIIGVTLLTDRPWPLLACAAVFAFGLYALDERGYFWLVVMLTPTVLLLLSLVDFQGVAVGIERTLDSALGIVVGLAIGEVAWRLGRLRAPDAAR